MLTYELLRNHAGVLLCGDYETLRDLHQVIHDVNDRSPIIRDKEGSFLELAYDVRKAYEGQRRALKAPEHYPEIGPRFGVEILWPVILFQSRVLRESMAFIDTRKGAQAQAYALEDVIEHALRADFGGDMGVVLIDQWMHLNTRHPWTEEQFNSRGAIFCSWKKAERKKYLVSLLNSLSPMYPSYYEVWTRNGAVNLISPAEYDAWNGAEWPDPKW